MKYLAIAALAVILGFFAMSISTPTANASPPPGCEDLNSPPPNWLLENGVKSCAAANALVNAEAACIAKLQEQLAIPYLAGSGAWWATAATDKGITISNFCPQSDEIRFGLSPCSDWMTNGPGTGPGINPESDIELCKQWAYEAFHYGAFQSPGNGAGVCQGLRGFECVELLTAIAEAETRPPVVTFTPPDAGDGGLIGVSALDYRIFVVLFVPLVIVMGFMGLAYRQTQ